MARGPSHPLHKKKRKRKKRKKRRKKRKKKRKRKTKTKTKKRPQAFCLKHRSCCIAARARDALMAPKAKAGEVAAARRPSRAQANIVKNSQ